MGAVAVAVAVAVVEEDPGCGCAGHLPSIASLWRLSLSSVVTNVRYVTLCYVSPKMFLIIVTILIIIIAILQIKCELYMI